MYEELTIPVTDKVMIEEPCGTPLLELTAVQCRFPVSYGDVTLFCGNKRRDPKTSFCSDHHKVVWVKPRKSW